LIGTSDGFPVGVLRPPRIAGRRLAAARGRRRLRTLFRRLSAEVIAHGAGELRALVQRAGLFVQHRALRVGLERLADLAGHRRDQAVRRRHVGRIRGLVRERGLVEHAAALRELVGVRLAGRQAIRDERGERGLEAAALAIG
jgi:hypothetical protein